jgi:branched-chain amino acid transport system substrate-binding protein
MVRCRHRSVRSDQPLPPFIPTPVAVTKRDRLFGKGYIRADGRRVHIMYLFEVKAPGDKAPYDYYNLVRPIPEEEAFRPMEQGECPLVRKE